MYTGERSVSPLCITYMRVVRVVQVLSELGYRGATPVLKHMQVGLSLILQTHRDTQTDRLVQAAATASHLVLKRQVML